MAFHRYLGVTFICTVAFHRLALDRRGNILGGIIGIHPLNHRASLFQRIQIGF